MAIVKMGDGSHWPDANSSRESKISEHGVWLTIKDMPLDKTPGLDGFTWHFYMSCWQIIKSDVLAALSAVCNGHVFKFKLLNSAFITLLPKKADACEVRDYRPISLVHSFAKLVIKLLVNRLAPRLPDMVSINQSAFVKGRSIQDNVLFVQQMARSLYRKKESHILLKLDITKAFDSVSWAFLLEVLQYLGFGRKLCNLLCLLLSTSSTRVLDNGEPGSPILHHPGFRLGDPLSPMLFLLAMEGLRTNFSKSSVTPLDCTDADLLLLPQLMDCEIKEFPCNYLGIPLTIRKPTKADLLPLIDKIAANLPQWKASLLSRAGRLVVVHPVFTAIPIHHMMAVDLPKWVIRAIDKLRRGFLWEGRQNANGGNCLLGKGSEAITIWWSWDTQSSNNGMGLAYPLAMVPRNAQALFDVALETKVGNGEDTKFWTDRWLQGCTVGELAPNLIQVVPKRARRQRSDSQALNNRTSIVDIQGALTVQELVDDFTLQPTVPDQHVLLTNSGIYTSKSARLLCEISLSLHLRKGCGKCGPLFDEFFIWLAVKNRCWTADRSSKHGLPHRSLCLLCDQVEENVQHILEVWTKILLWVGLQAVAPQPDEKRKGFNSLVILVARTIWKHRNGCVFQGLNPSVPLVYQEVGTESELWCLAGNMALQELLGGA
ncbi:hypothetical protein U9M48_039598 [Paspalum notatum var. saurae]|uniref:Reverse transcriptase domain-containing protein n=1 Tax=Paspalum notatum var. saurae TaxID=547442 RepID=A0AAQ3UJ93_PASNO